MGEVLVNQSRSAPTNRPAFLRPLLPPLGIKTLSERLTAIAWCTARTKATVLRIRRCSLKPRTYRNMQTNPAVPRLTTASFVIEIPIRGDRLTIRLERHLGVRGSTAAQFVCASGTTASDRDSAKKVSYSPNTITLNEGEPVVLVSIAKINGSGV